MWNQAIINTSARVYGSVLKKRNYTADKEIEQRIGFAWDCLSQHCKLSTKSNN